MNRIRVLVVEDSQTVRRRLCEVLAADPAVELIGEAADGRAAVALCRDRRPDVVTMDMILPVMNGLEATERIMAECPTPILVVSSSGNRGELLKTCEALAAGAVDALDKPHADEPAGAWERRLLAQVKLVARIRVITHPRQRLAAVHRRAAPRRAIPRRDIALLAIGASTGGPAAVAEVLRGLPVSFAQPILLVLHIGEGFGAGVAEWLAGRTGRRVVCARDGDRIAGQAGRVVIAPPGRHLIVERGSIRLSDDPERNFCRPSIDLLFASVAGEYGGTGAAALLTGMGRDGASGLLAIRRAGGLTVAQDEATSVVYGMPREAAVLGAAERILPLGEIGPFLGSAAAPLAEGRR